MPPKAKITKEMVIDAAFTIARENGAENINARTVAARLGCSTQPVMYHFGTIEALKQAAYHRADEFHTGYLMQTEEPEGDFLLGIGLNYIRFAIQEPRLFRFLFQSGHIAGNGLLDVVEAPELVPILVAMGAAMEMEPEKVKEVFLTVAMFAHGYASLIANNSLQYDEKTAAAHLERAYTGAVLAAQEENYEKNV